ncbi:MAG: DNA (cytosine-5-)-methyltransferase [Lachnospiraceae bacterium]|nr:DNA (cytosine-5-)-methyltransferase [Lachnospiraceae bacterium]
MSIHRLLSRNPCNDSAEYLIVSQYFSFADLFAGIGGIRMGFEACGGKCVCTSEWDPYAQKIYRANFQDDHKILGDITKIRPSDLPDFDVLLAGFPCQPFSIAGVSKKNSMGKSHGFRDRTQGTLFFNVASVLDAKRPVAFLLENVKNLVSHDHGHTFEVIMQTLAELGYVTSWKIIDGQAFVPQHRERTLIVGFRKDVGFQWPPLPKESHFLGEILHRKGDWLAWDEGRYTTSAGLALPKYTLSDHLWSYLKAYKEKHRAAGNGFGYSLFTHQDMSRTLSARYGKDGSECLIFQGKDRNPRRLTPRECARLMGFPDTFKIPVSDTRAYHAFGNSVVVPVMRWIAKGMVPYVHKALQTSYSPKNKAAI